ncbi:MAG: hypothetical protein PUC65_03715 [Clostridiales bacterium]|nr:hypothetical protein [Clostridiales bacterium]
MNLKNEKLKKFIICCIFQIMIYIFQFLIRPLFYRPDPMGRLACTIILYSSTFLFVFFGQLFFIKKVWCWILSFPIYPSLIFLYHPKNVYEIGYEGGFSVVSTEIHILVLSVIIFGIEMATCLLVGIISFIRKRMKQKRA